MEETIKPKELADTITRHRKVLGGEIRRLQFEAAVIDATIESYAAAAEGKTSCEFRPAAGLLGQTGEFVRRMDEAGIEAIYCEPACPSMGDKAYWRLLLK